MSQANPQATTAFLDGLTWRPGTCQTGQHQAQVAEVDHIEQGTLGGYPVYLCRRHAEQRLAFTQGGTR